MRTPPRCLLNLLQEEALLFKHVLPLLAVLANELHMPARAIKYAAEMERAAAPSSPGSSKDEKENKMASQGFFYITVNIIQEKTFLSNIWP